MKRAWAISTVAALALLAFGAQGATAAQPSLLWQLPEEASSGSGAGELGNPVGVADDPVSGNLYVTELANHRVAEFDIWGQFIRAFGWKVNAADPEEKLQVCTEQTGCQAGASGGGTGQLSEPFGIAVDEGGGVYVYDLPNHRVQKFDSEGHFLWMIGGGVNKTKVEEGAPEAEQNRCPVDPADVCQKGALGSGAGAFEASGNVFHSLAIGPKGTVYVGDLGRIEKFNSAGEFLGEVPGVESGRTVRALDVDPEGNLYISYSEKKGLDKLSATGTLLHTFPVIGSEGGLGEAGPHDVGIAASGNLYALSDPSVQDGNETVKSAERVDEFDAAGSRLLPSQEEEEEHAELEVKEEEPPPYFGEIVHMNIQSVATSSACGIEGEDIYVSYFDAVHSLLRAYGSPPNPNLCPPPERAPFITQQYANAVGSESATLGARISSNFWPTTTYYVEWGTGKCSEGGCERQQPAAPGTPLGSKTNLAVPTKGVILSGLQPGTTYHYRFVTRTKFQPGSGEVAEVKGAGGKVGEDGEEATFTTPAPPPAPRTDCPNQAFRTAASALLPDCRAYEMVSPIEKEGGDVLSLGAIIEGFRAAFDAGSESGDRFTYSGYRAFAGSSTAPYVSQYLATRGPSGWEGQQISPPRGRPVESPAFSSETEFKAFSPDLCHAWLRLEFEAEPVLDPAEVPGYSNLLRRDQCGEAPSYEALTTVEPPNVGFESFYPEVQGVTPDGRCTVIRSQDALTPEAPYLGVETRMELYESCAGAMRLVSFLPSGKPYEGPSSAGTAYATETSPQFQHRTASVLGATSADGTRIYWSTSGFGPGRLYLRINADEPQSAMAGNKCSEPDKGCTLPVSEKVTGEKAGFWAAAADGSRALFSSGEKLYEYETGAEPSKAKATQIATGFQGLLGASEDAKRIYFASGKALAPGALAEQPNLYFREAAGSPRLVGTLSTTDVDSTGAETQAIAREPFKRNARVSPDGLHAAFLSASPTLAEQTAGFDNTDQLTGKPDAEAYLYDAAANGGEGHLVCVSCDPSGERPIGRNIGGGTNTNGYIAAARLPRWTNDLYASRPLAADGSRLFFDSFVPLVGRDTNGKADVYEWQPAASQAACEAAGGERFSPASEGCLALISSGESSLDSEFLDASASGSDVFFTTAAGLVSQDPGLIDIYDARVDGGFPPPPQPPAGCEGEACQGPPAAPNDPTPASAALEGQGNVKPAAGCPKGKVARKGRCVSKHHRRKNHHRTHAKRRSHR